MDKKVLELKPLLQKLSDSMIKLENDITAGNDISFTTLSEIFDQALELSYEASKAFINDKDEAGLMFTIFSLILSHEKTAAIQNIDTNRLKIFAKVVKQFIFLLEELSNGKN